MPNKYEGHSYDDLKGLAGDDSLKKTEYHAAKREAERRSETPSHTELKEVMERSKKEERLDMSLAIVEGTLESLDLLGETLDPSKATELDDAGIENLTDRPAGDGPEIFYKQIRKPKTKKKRWFSKPEVVRDANGKIEESDEVTGEILVIIRLNNAPEGSDPQEEGTIVTAVVNQQKGVLQTGRKNPGIYSTRNEGNFKDLVDPTSPSSNQGDLCLGKITRNDYLREYRAENGESLDQYWQRHDASMHNRVDYWGSEDARKEMMHRLTGEYTEVMERFNDQIERVRERTKAEVKESEDRVEAAFNSREFNEVFWSGYAAALKSRRRDADAVIQGFERQMMKYGLSEAEIKALRVKYGVKKKGD